MDKRNGIPDGHPVDELAVVRQLLAEPPAGPDVIEAARVRLELIARGHAPLPAKAARKNWRPPGAARRAAARHTWPGWLTPVAAAAAATAVIAASLAISSVIQRGTTGPGQSARASAVFARVPRYFAVLSGSSLASSRRAVIVATATGAVVGTVTPPKPYTQFTTVTAARDGRTFVLAAARGPAASPVKFYRLVLRGPGHPGGLAPLPIPPQPGNITGFAASPDGSQLAVSARGPATPHDPKIQVFSMVSGAERDWVWPGNGWIGWNTAPGAGAALTLSWEADNRTLLFEEHDASGTAQARLLDTAATGGSLLAASRRVPIPSDEIGDHSRTGEHAPFDIVRPLLITGDGTKMVAPTSHGGPPGTFDVTITEFSVRTGKPVRIPYRQRFRLEPEGPAVLWVNASGTAMIAIHPSPRPNSPANAVAGVQTPATFAPLPPGVQHYLVGCPPPSTTTDHCH
jgi:hypothetical protein